MTEKKSENWRNVQAGSLVSVEVATAIDKNSPIRLKAIGVVLPTILKQGGSEGFWIIPVVGFEFHPALFKEGKLPFGEYILGVPTHTEETIIEGKIRATGNKTWGSKINNHLGKILQENGGYDMIKIHPESIVNIEVLLDTVDLASLYTVLKTAAAFMPIPYEFSGKRRETLEEKINHPLYKLASKK